MKWIAISALWFCLAVAAYAADSPPLGDIVAEQRGLRSQIEAGTGRFAEMPSVKRTAILADQQALFAILEGKNSLDELNDKQRVEAFNLLQRINAAIANKEDERVVCTRERRVGSNMVQKVCKSVAQSRAERDVARKGMQDLKTQCNSAACWGAN